MKQDRIEQLLRTPQVKPIMPHPLTKRNSIRLDLSTSNQEPDFTSADTVEKLQAYITSHLARGPYLYALGGYGEERSFYARFPHFRGAQQARSHHLGVDIWTAAQTPVMAPLRGEVHSLAHNDQPGDYGGTLILHHCIDDFSFHTLYGHLKPASISHWQPGDIVLAGQKIAELGAVHENVQWPPHLHFQIIIDMGDAYGDYPGVVLSANAARYRANCPHPEWLLRPAV